MSLEQIPEQDIRETLRRAEEIAQQRPVLGGVEFESFLNAAEEMGIPREATLQALSERRLLSSPPLTADDIVFVASEDQNLYAAIVLNTDGTRVSVRFVNGGDCTCSLADVHPLPFTPGSKLQYKYPGFGWISGRVCRYEAVTRTVWLSSAWEQQEREVPLSQVRLNPRWTDRKTSLRAMLWKVGLACGAGGALLGILLGHLLR